MTLAVVEETISRLEEQQTGKLARLGAIAQMLAHHEECLQRIRKVKEQIEVKQKEVDNWAGVAALFGSADGKKFRNIAQSYVLRQLLADRGLLNSIGNDLHGAADAAGLRDIVEKFQMMQIHIQRSVSPNLRNVPLAIDSRIPFISPMK